MILYIRGVPSSLCSWFVVAVFSISVCRAFSILEFIIGPSIGSNITSVSPKSAKVSEAQQLVESHGYPFEEHEVITEDGYILSLHRIPQSRKLKNINKTKKPVALFQHGLLAASDTFLFRGNDDDLPYLMADAGYDVWLSNMRGNIYSNKHQVFDSEKDPEFWKFSLHEVGYYDLPAVIDYVLNITKEQSLYFLGHSVGSSAAFILCSLRPEYNSKIRLHLALAPLVYVLHEVSFPHKIFLASAASVTQGGIAKNIFNVFPRREYFSKALDTFCSEGMPTQFLCLLIIFSLVGIDGQQLNRTVIPEFVSYFPAGSSIYLISHATQLYTEGTTFRALDYQNQFVNKEKYRMLEPPEYNLSMVTHPVSLHYGDGDFIVTEEDVNFTANKLPNVIGKFKVPFKNFNHMDFMIGSDAKDLVYKECILLMNKNR